MRMDPWFPIMAWPHGKPSFHAFVRGLLRTSPALAAVGPPKSEGTRAASSTDIQLLFFPIIDEAVG